MEKDKSKENEYYTRLVESKIFDFLSSHPESAKKIIDMLTPLKEQKEIKRNKKFMKFAPYIIVGALAIGGVSGIGAGKRMAENEYPDYPTTYSSIETAPPKVIEGYVNELYNDFTTASANADSTGGPGIDFDGLSKQYANFERVINTENPTQEEITRMAKEISNGTNADGIKETMPFEYTDYSKSIVRDGEVYIPAGNDYTEEDTLVSQDGLLYKKGR